MKQKDQFSRRGFNPRLCSNSKVQDHTPWVIASEARQSQNCGVRTCQDWFIRKLMQIREDV